MSFPFLAYPAVQHNNVSLMAETVYQIGLYRTVLKAGDGLGWRHIIGSQSQDTGLWSTGNGWAAMGGQLKSWIKEILDGAIQSGTDNDLLRNYLNNDSWFGEISGTALLSAVAYCMAVNDPDTFGKNYITWADRNRKNLASKVGANGIFSPTVNPLDWKDRSPNTAGSPEGQAFTVFLYTAYRDCVNAQIRQAEVPSATTISKPGIGPMDILTVLNAPLTFSEMPDPTGTVCGGAESCDADRCAGVFLEDVKHATCTVGLRKGCRCKTTDKTCGPHASCDGHGCAGSFNALGSVAFGKCTGNFEGCDCLPTDNICGPHQPCDKNGCDGSFDGLGNVEFPQCTGNFKGCECTATVTTCGAQLPCNLHGCAGSFSGLGNADTCGSPQDCGKHGCNGEFNLDDGEAYCANNFKGCHCNANLRTCGNLQSCNGNNCQGKFSGRAVWPVCTNFFLGCVCEATDETCGPPQSCDNGGCAGGFDASGVARCQGNFKECECMSTKNTCGQAQNCDRNGCNGSFDANSNTARCRGNFNGCVCKPVAATCGGDVDSCSANGCNNAFNDGNPICTDVRFGCPCRPDPIWIPPPPPLPPPPSESWTSFALIALEKNTPQPHQFLPDTWHVFNINGVFTGDTLCTLRDFARSGGKVPFPESMPAFDMKHFTNCRYSGSSGSVGAMSYDGASSVSCVETHGASDCNAIDGSRYADAALAWTIKCTIDGPESV